jgi:Xaa-Pro dipeptidase
MPQAVPQGELRFRIARLQESLAAQGVDLALIRQPADLYYYAGALADGFLAVPAEGAPKFLVRRPQERLAAAETPWDLVFYRDLGDLQALLNDLSGPRPGCGSGVGRPARGPVSAFSE